MNNVCVLGSMNMDMVLTVDRMPRIGETITSAGYKLVPGGKGANQAVAARRLGGKVSFIGRIGSDDYGNKLLKSLENEGIDTDHIGTDKELPTGMAIITVNSSGDNSIVLVEGSNAAINESHITQASNLIFQSDILIAQFETPVEATIEAFKLAQSRGIKTILNPAPARDIPDKLLKLTDIIVPNETEIFELTGIKPDTDINIRKAASKLLEKGVKYVIITLGSRGAAIISNMSLDVLPTIKVNVVDTTAAGDSFIGALASHWDLNKNNEYESLKSSVAFANKVSSIVVQRHGAQPSIPSIEEVQIFYSDYKL